MGARALAGRLGPRLRARWVAWIARRIPPAREIVLGQRNVFILCGIVAAFDGFDIQSIAFAAPAIGADLGIAQESFGLIFSAGIIGMFLGLLVQGQVADKIGRRPMIMATVAIFALATLATAFTVNTTQLVCARLICGVGMA